MISYETARQLKSMGFPDIELHENCTTPLECDKTKFPSLTSLIEGCGDEFAYLKRYHPSGIWEAATDGFEIQDMDRDTSVANLWLALNKK